MRLAVAMRATVALGLVAMLAMVGCSKANAPLSTSPASTSGTTAGSTSTPIITATSTGPQGILTVGAATFGNETYDPTVATGGFALLAPMFDFLVRQDPSGKSNGVAQRWEMAPEGLSWTFYIRKGITFHDGSTLTAKDVKFTLDRYASKSAFLQYIRDAQDRVEVVDDYTVRVSTKGPQPYYREFVNFDNGIQGMILPKDYFEKNGLDAFKTRPVGSGPFRFVSHDSGDSAKYEAVSAHYRQVPAYKALNIALIPEETTRIAALKTGTVDIIDIGLDSAPGMEAAGLRTASLAGSQAVINLYGTYDPRAKNLPLADIRMRQALSLAINRLEMGQTLFHGKLQPVMPPDMWQNQPGIDVSYWKAEAAKVYRYDPAAAIQLLRDSGRSQGFTMSLYSYVVSGASYLPSLAPVLQGYWQKIGVKTQIVPLDYAAFSALRKGPADALVGAAALHGASGNVVPATALSPFFSSGGSSALLGKSHPEVDSFISGALTEPNDAKRTDLTAKAVRASLDAYVTIVIGGVPSMVGLGPRVDIAFPTGAMGISQFVEIAKHRQ